MSEIAKKQTKLAESVSNWKNKVLYSVVLVFGLPLFALIVVLPASAVGVVVYQSFVWLKNGEWVGISTTLFFKYLLSPDNSFVQWLDTPQSWYGLHYLVTGAPLSAFLLLVGVVIFFVYSAVAELVSNFRLEL